MKVKVINTNPAGLPKYAKKGDAGMDVMALIVPGTKDTIQGNGFTVFRKSDNNLAVNLKPGGRVTIPTGLFVELPPLHEFQVRPRSGLAAKYGITVLNAPGTIDMGYRDEIKVILVNTSTEAFIIDNGDRIGQIVLNKFEEVEWVSADELSESERGKDGLGSTGR